MTGVLPKGSLNSTIHYQIFFTRVAHLLGNPFFPSARDFHHQVVGPQGCLFALRQLVKELIHYLQRSAFIAFDGYSLFITNIAGNARANSICVKSYIIEMIALC